MLKQTITLIAITLFLSACSNKELAKPLSHDLEKKEKIYSIKQAKTIDVKQLVHEVEHYPVIFVGDHHNNSKTHKFFEGFLKQLDKEGYTLHLANEWFTPSHNKLLQSYTNGDITSDELKQKRDWDKFTSFKWEYVAPLYEAVKKNNGRLYGINITKESRDKISLRQLDKMNEAEKKFYNNLDLNVSAHKQLVSPYLKHCNQIPSKSPEPCEERMYRVQVTWDTYMAKNVAKIVKSKIKTKKDKVIIFAGAFHIEQNVGIPLRFSRLSNLPFITISNELINKDSNLEIDTNKADIVYIYEDENSI